MYRLAPKLFKRRPSGDPPIPAPVVLLVTPNEGPPIGGNFVSVTGTGFDNADVTFDGIAATSQVLIGPTEIQCVVPAGAAGAANVVVTNLDAQTSGSSGDAAYTYSLTVPTVTTISPNQGPVAGGTPNTLVGTNIQNGALVYLDDVLCPDIVWTDTENIAFTSTPSPTGLTGWAQVKIVNPDLGTTIWPYNFAYAPTVADVSPASGSPAGGTSVTVTGTGFDQFPVVPYVFVEDGTLPAHYATNVVWVSAAELTCDMPAHASGAVDVTVRTAVGFQGTKLNAYTYSVPTLVSVTPDYGSRTGGTSGVATGTDLLAGDIVKIGGIECTMGAITATTAAFTTPDFDAGGMADAARDVTLWRGGVLQDTLAAAFFTFTFTDYSDCVVDLPPENIVEAAGVVTDWTNRGSATLTPTAGGSPVYDDADPVTNYPSVGFTAASSQSLILASASAFITGDSFEYFDVSVKTANVVGGGHFVIRDNSANDWNTASSLMSDETATDAETYRFSVPGPTIARPATETLLHYHVRAVDNAGVPTNTDYVIRINTVEGIESTQPNRLFDVFNLQIASRWVTSAVTNFASLRFTHIVAYANALSGAQRTVVQALLSFEYGGTP